MASYKALFLVCQAKYQVKCKIGANASGKEQSVKTSIKMKVMPINIEEVWCKVEVLENKIRTLYLGLCKVRRCMQLHPST